MIALVEKMHNAQCKVVVAAGAAILWERNLLRPMRTATLRACAFGGKDPLDGGFAAKEEKLFVSHRYAPRRK